MDHFHKFKMKKFFLVVGQILKLGILTARAHWFRRMLSATVLREFSESCFIGFLILTLSFRWWYFTLPWFPSSYRHILMVDYIFGSRALFHRTARFGWLTLKWSVSKMASVTLSLATCVFIGGRASRYFSHSCTRRQGKPYMTFTLSKSAQVRSYTFQCSRLRRTSPGLVIDPVSYTHLDVYKRQPLYGLPYHSMDSRCSIVMVIPLIHLPIG